MLNRTTTAPVCQIEPRNTYSRQDERQAYKNQDNEHPRSLDRRRRDDDGYRNDNRQRSDDRRDHYRDDRANDDYDWYDDDRDERSEEFTQ